MSAGENKFKPEDRVRHVYDHSTATILAVHEDLYWVQYDDDRWTNTVAVAEFDRYFELITEQHNTTQGEEQG